MNWNCAEEWERLLGSPVKCLRVKLKCIGLVGQREVKRCLRGSPRSLKEAKGKLHSLPRAVAPTLPRLVFPSPEISSGRRWKQEGVMTEVRNAAASHCLWLAKHWPTTTHHCHCQGVDTQYTFEHCHFSCFVLAKNIGLQWKDLEAEKPWWHIWGTHAYPAMQHHQNSSSLLVGCKTQKKTSNSLLPTALSLLWPPQSFSLRRLAELVHSVQLIAD